MPYKCQVMGLQKYLILLLILSSVQGWSKNNATSSAVATNENSKSAAIKTATNKPQTEKSLSAKSTQESAVKIKLKKIKPAKNATKTENNKLAQKESYYLKNSRRALRYFISESFNQSSTSDTDFIFLKIENELMYKKIKPQDYARFSFQNLTDEVIRYLDKLKSNYRLASFPKEREAMQLTYFGLSQAIKKGNELNLSIQSEQFNKLHDALVSQSTFLYYSTYREARRSDLFWISYYLKSLNYPMDLTAKHLMALDAKIKNYKYPEKYHYYGLKLAKLSLTLGDQVSRPSADQVDSLYGWAHYFELPPEQLQSIQKAYLKQLQLGGDLEKVKEFKKELATNLLYRESKNILYHPLNILKYVQFLIGYIFVAWPLEVILIILSLSIFALQSSTVLSYDERRRAKRFDKRLWMMFTKAYLGSNVPFFSKLAASLILFGVGLYFNSAKNFVESMISNL
jgi:hypothetical protein